MTLVHSRHKEKKRSKDEPESKQSMDLVRNGVVPEFVETMSSVSLDGLADLKRRYAAFIIQMDRLRPSLVQIDSRPLIAGSWSIREILGHLIDTDRDIWWPRIEAARLNEHPHFENIDQEVLTREHDWESQSIEQILSQLVRARWQYGMKLNSIAEHEFERTGEHEVLGEISVLRMLQIMVAHDEYYLTKIRAILNSSRSLDERTT